MCRRSVLYRWARLLGDYQAVKRGRVGKRLARRYAGKAACAVRSNGDGVGQRLKCTIALPHPTP
jgi:hypothetical protein